MYIYIYIYEAQAPLFWPSSPSISVVVIVVMAIVVRSRQLFRKNASMGGLLGSSPTRDQIHRSIAPHITTPRSRFDPLKFEINDHQQAILPSIPII
jgi:hypothetical protein